ncbi:MAG TPA: hypothetical protein VHT30_04120 [Acidimicrobiales bacterium]|jgi:hypothetical protein|nr:hypothetical protein [Acidimicrobiales bacterium]
MTTSELEERFATVIEAMAGQDGVTVGSGRRGFGSDALQVQGRIFAMARRGGLVLKLPAGRVDALLRSGLGDAFDAGKGKPMKEWVVVSLRAHDQWVALASEALAYVAGASS